MEDLFMYFQGKAVQNNSLFQVEIDVCENCNANCIFCYQGEHSLGNDRLSIEELKELLFELRKLGTYSIGFSGGEPFMRPDFLDILKIARSLHFRISIITNGMLLNKSVIDKLDDIFVERITISFHSVNNTTYQKIFGINNPNTFNQVINKIKYMLEKRMNIGIAVTVTNQNISEVEHIKNFFESMGINQNNISFNMLLSGKKDISYLLPTYDDLLIHREVFEVQERALYERKKDEIRCIAGRSSCSINSKGDVFPCTFFNTPVGNVRKENIKNIWENSHVFKMLRSIKKEHFEKCSRCAYENDCSICICDNMNQTGNMFSPHENYCMTRKARLKNV